MLRAGKALLVFLLLVPVLAHADGKELWQKWVSPKQFQDLAIKASRNVDLFQKVWEADPTARFYGGTSRDFLWFIRGELSKARTEAEVKAIISDLESRPLQIKEFIVGQSDVDVITDRFLSHIDFDREFITRIETISPSWFKKGTKSFEQEKLQGYVPTEKVMLGQKDFKHPEGLDYGDGIKEIYEAKPSFSFNPRIVETDFYKNKGNHPILLACRYLRQVAMAYYRKYGKTVPTKELLDDLMPPESKKAVEKIFAEINADPAVLEEYLANHKFTDRLNKALGKAFRSYTNPNATKLLFEMFGVDRTLAPFGKAIKPYHTLTYKKDRNPKDIQLQRDQLGLDPKTYVFSAGDFYKKQKLAMEHDETLGDFCPMFHGTDSMDAYTNIVFQGNLPSTRGNAGPGTYTVDPRSKSFAETWKVWKNGKGLVVELFIDPKATIVDITDGPGKRAFEEFKHRRLAWYFDGKKVKAPGSDESAFADFVGADIIKYPYAETHAYVIKNGAAVLGQEGITVPVMTFEKVREDLKKHGYSRDRLLELAELNHDVIKRPLLMLKGAPPDKIVECLSGLILDPKARKELDPGVLLAPELRTNPERLESILQSLILEVEQKRDEKAYRMVEIAVPSLDPALQDSTLRALIESPSSLLKEIAIQHFAGHELPAWLGEASTVSTLVADAERSRNGNQVAFLKGLLARAPEARERIFLTPLLRSLSGELNFMALAHLAEKKRVPEWLWDKRQIEAVIRAAESNDTRPPARLLLLRALEEAGPGRKAQLFARLVGSEAPSLRSIAFESLAKHDAWDDALWEPAGGSKGILDLLTDDSPESREVRLPLWKGLTKLKALPEKLAGASTLNRASLAAAILSSYEWDPMAQTGGVKEAIERLFNVTDSQMKAARIVADKKSHLGWSYAQFKKVQEGFGYTIDDLRRDFHDRPAFQAVVLGEIYRNEAGALPAGAWQKLFEEVNEKLVANLSGTEPFEAMIGLAAIREAFHVKDREEIRSSLPKLFLRPAVEQARVLSRLYGSDRSLMNDEEWKKHFQTAIEPLFERLENDTSVDEGVALFSIPSKFFPEKASSIRLEKIPLLKLAGILFEVEQWPPLLRDFAVHALCERERDKSEATKEDVSLLWNAILRRTDKLYGEGDSLFKRAFFASRLMRQSVLDGFQKGAHDAKLRELFGVTPEQVNIARPFAQAEPGVVLTAGNVRRAVNVLGMDLKQMSELLPAETVAATVNRLAVEAPDVFPPEIWRQAFRHEPLAQTLGHDKDPFSESCLLMRRLAVKR